MSELETVFNLFAGATLAVLIIAVIMIIAILIFGCFYIVCLWKLFKKAGKNGWEAIIPFYNEYILIKIAGLHWWYFPIALISSITISFETEDFSWIVNIANTINVIINFFIFYNLAKKMNREPVGIAIGGAIAPGIMIPVLALSKKFNYNSYIPVNPNGPIGDKNRRGIQKYCLGCGQELKPNSVFCENCGKKVE